MRTSDRARAHVVRDTRNTDRRGRRAALALRIARACRRGSHGRTGLRARRRDARARFEPRSLERLRRRVGDHHGGPRRSPSCAARRRDMRALATVCCKAVLGAMLVVGVSGCGGGDDTPTEVVLVTHDSFVISDDVRREFETSSGLELRILQSGDAGELVSKALLTAGNPQGDVLFGLDNTFLSRALEGDLFEPYESPLLDRVDERYVLDPEHRVTPIDHGEVCLNYDKEWFASRQIEPPRSLDDLVDERLEGLARRREPRHLHSRTCVPPRDDRALTASRAGRTSGARCASTTSSSSTAGRRRTTRGSREPRGGNRPIVVSYASSPPAEVIFGEPAARRGPHGGRRGQLLQPDRARRGAPGSAERGGSARARRLHALEALPGGHPALDVRLPGEQRGRAAARVRAATRSSPKTRSSCHRRRSRRIATGG